MIDKQRPKLKHFIHKAGLYVAFIQQKQHFLAAPLYFVEACSEYLSVAKKNELMAKIITRELKVLFENHSEMV